MLLNASKIASVKEEIASEPFVAMFAGSVNVNAENVTAIDDKFKEKLFAEWVRNTPSFPSFKRKYEALQPRSAYRTNSPNEKVVPFSTKYIEQLLNDSIETVAQRNGPDKRVIVPKALNHVLFNGWQKNSKIPLVLGAFAEAMDLSTDFTARDGTKIILQPPEPPLEEQIRGEFLYKKFGIFCFETKHFQMLMLIVIFGREMQASRLLSVGR